MEKSLCKHKCGCKRDRTFFCGICFHNFNEDEGSSPSLSKRMKLLQESGLIGCLNETGITSENYKEKMFDWSIHMFPMGGFWANSADGRFAFGKCDPLTKKIVEWHEFIEKGNSDGSRVGRFNKFIAG